MARNPITQAFSQWFQRNFADPEAISLFMTLVLLVLVLEWFGHVLLPIILSIIIAYLLASLVRLLVRLRVPNGLAVTVVYLLFIGLLVLSLTTLIPLLARQFSNLVDELPNAFNHAQNWFNTLVAQHPKLFGQLRLQDVTNYLQSESAHVGQIILKYSLSTIPNIIQVVLYFVLVPVLVLFFLKDSRQITRWLSRFLPSHHTLLAKVWNDINEKIGAYVRGRVLEIIIVSVVSTATFAIVGLQYAFLLGFLVGLSVLIPYVGAVVVTIPVIIIALMQWGFDARFWTLVISYAVIIALDGYVLAPILFSDVMDLHPSVVIIAVVIFGAMWGFWGVFFAIPLATLVNVVIKRWPKIGNVAN